MRSMWPKESECLINAASSGCDHFANHGPSGSFHDRYDGHSLALLFRCTASRFLISAGDNLADRP